MTKNYQPKKYNQSKKKTKKNKRLKKTKKGGSSVSNGVYTQLNVNGLTYKFPIYYFKEPIQMLSNSNDLPQWNNWFQQYIDTRNPNSQFGSLTLQQSMQ